MTECSQENCCEPAAWSYVWPGRPERSYVCEKHFKAATNISLAMGFLLGDIKQEDAVQGKED